MLKIFVFYCMQIIPHRVDLKTLTMGGNVDRYMRSNLFIFQMKKL